MLELVLQAVIGVLSVAAIWMLPKPQPWARWGFVLGLMGQPFWIYVTFNAHQWGMFATAIVMTWAWGEGVMEKFFRKQ